MTKKRRRPIHLHVMVSEEEQALIQQRMAESGIRNMGAYMRKMALNGYVLHVDLSPVRELVSLQRRCSNNLNQVAIQANTYGGIYPEEIAALQRDYAALWGPLSDLLKKLSDICSIRGEDAGVHLLLEFRNGLTEAELIRRAEAECIRVYPLSEYSIDATAPGRRPTILLGYATKIGRAHV